MVLNPTYQPSAHLCKDTIPSIPHHPLSITVTPQRQHLMPITKPKVAQMQTLTSHSRHYNLPHLLRSLRLDEQRFGLRKDHGLLALALIHKAFQPALDPRFSPLHLCGLSP